MRTISIHTHQQKMRSYSTALELIDDQNCNEISKTVAKN